MREIKGKKKKNSASAKANIISDSDIALDKNALTVLQKRYLKKNVDGEILETPQEMFYRVAHNIAQADKIYDKQANTDKLAEEFYRLIVSLDFLPNSPTLMNAGRHLQQLSACFVLPVEDSMDSIFETLKNTALIHKSGGGTGFSFSRLRPNKDSVCSTSGVSSGPVSFMHVFNSATEAIKQGGTRRGANMGMLRIDHPDILDFISCKNENAALNNFNISVAVTDEFMKALKEDAFYDLYNPRTGQSVGKLKAKEVFDKIVDQSWKNGEPGIVFIDRMNDKNPTPKIGKIEATNPCGEQPLLPYESCNLGSINLGKFVKNKKVDWDRLGEVVVKAVHFLDNVIDMNKYPMSQIAKTTRANRKIGLGIMGWADMLLFMEIPYGSQESFDLAQKVMKFIEIKSHEASQNLALERGAFPNFKDSVYADGKPMRNATITTIAPTGTIGLIAGASGGIEPIFALVYKREQCLDKDEMYIINPYFEKVAKENGFYSPEIMDKISRSGSVSHIEEVPEHFRKVFATAHDITPEQHVKMQAAFQQWTDNAVSKTVNFPNSASKEDVEKVYILSYEMGCKGITVYRDGSRDMQVLNLAKKSETKVDKDDEKKKPRIRPNKTIGYTYLVNTGCQRMYVTINEDDKGACEMFMRLGKSGGCPNSQTEAIGRLVSLALRSNVDLDSIIEQLKGIRCPNPIMSEGGAVLSCADAVARVLENYKSEKSSPELFAISKIANGNTYEHEPKYLEPETEYKRNDNFSGACPQCPDCGEMLSFSEGCVKCNACGYSRCS
ncbi:MAG: vitamin B12-dependent ribonucleotide reductase [Elusimicrobiota bacterium]|jgi:ribonucleoside-diphosphate reductase alpha chain|nr:vitamin B12-dependent ribonucleotide reductase [Elusimicrobiota bacterium]